MNQKLENLLNLALETPEAVREETESLNVGFDPESRTWELIVKYHGSLDALTAMNVRVEYLIAGYAVLTVPDGLVDAVSQLEEIEYIEKPKRYFYSRIPSLSPILNTGADMLTDACIYPLTRREPYLSGSGILIAVLDSGIDYERQDFRNPDGTTRILALWDQTAVSGQPPAGFLLGSEYTREQINEALQAQSPMARMTLVPSIDASGHGTAVAGIAAGKAVAAPGSVSGGSSVSGSGSVSGGSSVTAPGNAILYEGAATESSLLIVKLGLPRESGFPRTTEIMRGVTYAVRKALEWNMPLVINLSFGNSYGSHAGSSLLERFLDNAAEIGRTVICVGSGNEGNSAGHAAGNVGAFVRSFPGTAPEASGTAAGSPGGVVDLAVAEYERNLSIQLWTHYSDSYRIRLRSPGGLLHELPTTGIAPGNSSGVSSGKYTFRMEQTELLVYLGEPTPYSVDQELYLEMIPVSSYINSGIWQILIEPVEIVTGQYYLYLPAAAARSIGTGFTAPTPQVTLTIPSTAAKVITVGAYDSTYDSYADFSGRGYVDSGRTIGVVTAGLVKPDLAAPGVNLMAPDLYGGYQNVTGTSFATPLVSGSAALLMEWGIIRGNDPFLYGEKVKAYLRKGAQPIRGEAEYPNNRVGFGALCAAKSLPL